MRLKVVSLTRYEDPNYPTHGILDEHPELLQLVPKRWRGNAAVIGALTALCLISSGCRNGSGEATVSRVAPVFQHGTGRAGYGCVAVAAPVFLSEDEARHVIEQEASKAGLSFAHGSKKPLALRPQEEQTVYDESGKDQGFHTRRKERSLNLVLDGMDKGRSISYEYVSNDDFRSWNLAVPYYGSTAWEFDHKRTAELLRQGLLKARCKGVYAVFYDPCADFSSFALGEQPSFRGGAEIAKRYPKPQSKWTSENQLRAQVRDFIKWLKAQGVI